MAVLQVGHVPAADVVVDKGDIVAVFFRFHLEAVQHGGEVLVGQAALPFIHEQDAQIIGTVRFQGTGRCIGQVPHAACRCTDALSCCGGNVRLVVQGLADGCDGYAAFFCQIFQGWHRFRLLSKVCLPGMCFVKPLIVFASS